MPGDFDLVKERVDIVQLIGERVPLRKAGRAYKGLCPFHAEKTPSFTVDPDRRTYKCFGCLPPGSLIKTEAGARPIEEIRVGDGVYAADGRLHPVLLTHEHWFEGDLVKLMCAPFKIPVVLTPNHRVPVLRPKSRRTAQIEAGSIRPQNYLVYPFIQRTRSMLDWSALPSWFGTRGLRPKPLPIGVDVPLFAEWLGWYLAEGSVSNDRSVRFSLGGDESVIADRLRELTQILFAERLRSQHLGSRIELWFCHALLSRWLKHHCGDGAKNKRIPGFVWSWTAQQQWTLFRALLLGDGNVGQGGYVARYGFLAQPSWSIGVASPTLIDDLRDLLIRNGVVPSIREHRKPNGRMSWHITVTADAQQRWGSGERPPWETVPVRVRKVDHVRYEGSVYNLTIDEEHTYLTMSGAVCNCGEGGDVFTWLEKIDGLEPVEALNQLAERAGVELSRRPPEAREREKRLQAAHDTALFYFRQALRGTEHGRSVARYLDERGIAAASVEAFGLGYGPDLRDGLLAYLRKKGYADEEIVASGLVVSTDRGLFDRFRDRLTVPIRDARGHVIAFGGRAMNPSQTAKYVNSPQTVLFNKSATLYALDAARATIRKTGEVVIVEGYFDAIACHQAGIDNVVASMGTALTEEQYRVLDEMKIERAVVAFDADAAGQRSAEKRGRELARIVQRVRRGLLSTRTGLQVYIATLAQGDPDDLARSAPGELRRLVAEARPVLQFVIDEVAGRYDLGGSPDARRRFLAETLPLLADEPDVIARELYLGTLSRLTGVDQETLRAQAATARPPEAGRRAAVEGRSEPEKGPEGKQTTSAERYLMAELAQFPEEAARIDLAPDDLQDPDHRAIFEHLRSGGRPNADLPAHVAATFAALRLVAPEHEVTADVGRAIEITALRLREQNLRRRLGEAKAQLARAADGDVGGQDDEVARVADELERVMRSRESATVLRASEGMETE